MLAGQGYQEAETSQPSRGFAAGDRGDGGLLGAEAGDGEGAFGTTRVLHPGGRICRIESSYDILGFLLLCHQGSIVN